MKLSDMDKCKGATILEFCFSLFFFIFMLGSFFDVGLALHKWMLLRHVTLESVREIAVRFATKPECSSISAYLTDKAAPRLQKELNTGISPGKMHWSASWIKPIESASNELSFPKLQLTGEFPVSCYFICQFFPDGWNLSATSETVIETKRFPEDFPEDGCPKVNLML